MEIKEAFGQVLRDFRTEAGFSQERLALECDLDRTFISLLERGKRRATLDTVFALAATLEVTPVQMVEETSRLMQTD